ncbi:MAG TPA: homogentisate 1,2-dioxygenase [Gammaproteobacteria bacterium]|nr:homogentisate 1,2-dioxygenase [Gammaproteobacteria bacterium]
MPGFHNEHASEAHAGALPIGQFSPQAVPYGLYAEKFSGTAFTVARRDNRRTWFYRLRPSVRQGAHRPHAQPYWLTAPLAGEPAPPDPLRWSPFPIPDAPTDFIDGLRTFAANGDAALQAGIGIHVYAANGDMRDRYLAVHDGELLFVPQQGRLLLDTECGRLAIAPGEIGVLPRGMKCRIGLPDGPSRGYVAENYGAGLRLPERGPVGSDGYANDRDFLAPVARYETDSGSFELISKFGGRLWRCDLRHSPLDVVAWIGTSVPYKYDLARFNAMNTVSYDHPDPSIFTVLSAPSDTAGVANLDFVIFPSRWMVAEHTFRPPWFHRNVMSEFMGLVYGAYDAKENGFEPGGASLHNGMVPHGPDAQAHAKASSAELKPERYTATLAFMFESRYLMKPSAWAMSSPQRQHDYAQCWQGLDSRFAP